MKNADKPINVVRGSDGVPFSNSDKITEQWIEQSDLLTGLTKREYFAAMAMQGICANPTNMIKPFAKPIAKVAIEIADELLKQLES